MKKPTALIAINASWNIVNFRQALVRGLRDRGFRVVGLAPHDRHSVLLAELGVEYWQIEMDRQGSSPLRDLRLLLRYHRLLGRIAPDVYLGFTAKPNIYGSLAAHVRGIPVINNVAGLGTAFIREGWLAGLVRFLYRLAFRRSRIVFFQNDEDLEAFVGSGIVRSDQVRLLPGSGIDLIRFAPGPGSEGTAPVTFLFVGRLLRDKGVAEYAEAARLLRAELPDARFQLLGPLDAPNRTAISPAEVSGWVYEGLVDYLGEADDVRPFIAAADCVVLPSYREGLPRVLLEAGAMGKPVVATDVPGCRAVVEHGVNGLLCAVRDAKALAAAMLEMARYPADRRAAIGLAGRARVEEDYAESRVVQLYLAAIDEALASGSDQSADK